MLEKSIQISVDKITLVGTFKQVYQYKDTFNIFLLSFNKWRFDIKKVDEDTGQCFSEYNIEQKNTTTIYHFNQSYMVNNLCFFQFHDTEFKIRLDFNPNLIDQETKLFIKQVLCYCDNLHLTRLDVCHDLFNYKLIDYNITSLKPLKKAYYYDRSHNLETVYIGAMASDRFIRVYDKTKEQTQKKKKDVPQDWWRVELQIRDLYIDKFLNTYNDFYEDLLIFKYSHIENYDITEKATINYLLQDITRISQIKDKRTQKKYRDIIRNLQLESIDNLNDVAQAGKSAITNILSDYKETN